MTPKLLINASYFIVAMLFILGLKGMSSPVTAIGRNPAVTASVDARAFKDSSSRKRGRAQSMTRFARPW